MPIRTPIGGDIDDFRLPPKEGLRLAAGLGFQAAEFGAAGGELAPENLSQSGRRHLARYAEGLGLTLSSVVADMPSLRLTDPRSVNERVERTCQILELSRELAIPMVTAAVGALTHPETGEPSDLALAALRRIGEFADSRGVVYAIRPAHDGPDRILRVLRMLSCPALGVCLDPAALIMAGLNPQSLVAAMPDSVSLVHARDGTAGLPQRPGHETALGSGDADWTGILAALRDAEYQGAYILRRTDSQTPVADVEAGRDFLRQYLDPR